jgi:GNAT superfamily N-acetyltransferase
MKTFDFTVEHVVPADFAALERIEAAYGGDPDSWDAGTVYVARHYSGKALGFCRFADKANRTVLRRIVVDPAWRGSGVGTAFVERLRLRLGDLGRSKVVAYTDVETTGTNLFMSRVGFTAVDIDGDRIRWEAGPLDHCPSTIYSDSVSGVCW